MHYSLSYRDDYLSAGISFVLHCWGKLVVTHWWHLECFLCFGIRRAWRAG
jgi:hypothetical protein